MIFATRGQKKVNTVVLGFRGAKDIGIYDFFMLRVSPKKHENTIIHHPYLMILGHYKIDKKYTSSNKNKNNNNNQEQEQEKAQKCDEKTCGKMVTRCRMKRTSHCALHPLACAKHMNNTLHYYIHNPYSPIASPV